MKLYMKSAECAKELGISLKYFQNTFVFTSGLDTWADRSPTNPKRRMWDKDKFELWMMKRIKSKK